MSFHRPSSWYDPPEYKFQEQAEKIYESNLFGIYETDRETGKIIHYDLIPEFYGSKEDMERILADWTENDADDASRYVIEALSFDSCCEMAEAEYEAGLDAYDDYKYDLEREAQPCDYDDEYY